MKRGNIGIIEKQQPKYKKKYKNQKKQQNRSNMNSQDCLCVQYYIKP